MRADLGEGGGGRPAGWRAGPATARGITAFSLMVAAAASMAWVGLLGPRLHDPDSLLYAAMAEDLAGQPLARWLAPEWGGHWQRTGRFFEHPHGHLWLAAALVRAGLGGQVAVCLLNAGSLSASLGLLHALGCRLASPPVARLAVLLWATSPAFLQYLVRGNQEHPMALMTLLALWGLIGARRAGWRGLAWGAGLAGACLTKGVAALALVPIAALGRAAAGAAVARGGILVGSLGAVAALGALEACTWAATGAGLWPGYLREQVGASLGGLGLARKLDNLGYYAWRTAWMGLPATLLLARCLVVGRRLSRPAAWPPAARLAALVSGVFVLGFCLADRRAERYVFPALPLMALGAAAAWHAVRPANARGADARGAGAWRLAPAWAWAPLAAAWVVAGTGAKLWCSAHLYRAIRIGG